MKREFFWRIIIAMGVIFFTTLFLTSFSKFENFRKQEILSTMISVISIIIAIIVTYLFSKLFYEKGVKVERKKEIDKLSRSITLLRRLAFTIRSMHDFWRFRNQHVNVNIKSMIDARYGELTYEEYRGYNVEGNRQFTPEEHEQIDIDISGSDGQAYLALKASQDDENTFVMFKEFHPQNYSLEDISRYDEYAGSFWYFLDRSDRVIYDFNRVSRYHLNQLDELYFKIKGSSINQDNYRNSVKELFSFFSEDIFPKTFYLLRQQNSNNFSTLFRTSFLNMLFFLQLLISAMIIYVVDGSAKFNYISTIFVVSIFITNTIDLIIITYNSILNELKVDEVYEL